MSRYILALDQGTTSSRALLFDHGGAVVAVDQYEFTQHFPNPGWVEHDADEIWESQLRAARGVMEKASVSATEITVIRFSGVPGELVRPSVLLLSRVEMNSIVSR